MRHHPLWTQLWYMDRHAQGVDSVWAVKNGEHKPVAWDVFWVGGSCVTCMVAWKASHREPMYIQLLRCTVLHVRYMAGHFLMKGAARHCAICKWTLWKAAQLAASNTEASRGKFTRVIFTRSGRKKKKASCCGSAILHRFITSSVSLDKGDDREE